ncbi:MAG TPA: hypothetical protein VMV50_02895 [Candidatus Paceibacterota bacterium]|nr:hypothetical protein [Candidatus Paceibacterota bacterium]
MNEPTDIERVVMRRVHTIRLLRPLISSGALAVLVFILALWGIGREVWVAHVFQNMPRTGGPVALDHFWLAAFAHTRLVVQALVLVTLGSLVYLARTFARTVTHSFSAAHA